MKFPSHRDLAAMLAVGVAFFPLSTPAQNLAITEFMAVNQNTLDDEDGDASDWIEITNRGAVSANLEGWFLTDDATLPTKWVFPSHVLAPSQSVLVFASDKDRNDPDDELHANFKLTGAGEYLALVKPDGTTVASEYAPAYPPQAEDVSYGFTTNATQTTLLAQGAAAKYRIPTNADDDVNEGLNPDPWIGTSFDDSGWSDGTTGIGYATAANDAYDPFIGTDVQSPMYNTAGSVYIRIPFTVANANDVTALTLRMQFDDGFVAYLNGIPEPVAALNAPGTDTLAWNSFATALHDDSQAVLFRDFPLSAGDLVSGTNYLCIHGLNRTANSSDLLIVPELVATVLSSGTDQAVYFTSPTPGEPNTAGTANPGPLIRSVTRDVAPLTVSSSPLVTVADSEAEFSGVQGQNGWRYGYHQGGGPFPPTTDFIEFAGGVGFGAWNGTTQTWSGSAWDANTAAAGPWTAIGSNSVHPNDSNPGPEQATVRRWVSDASGTHTIAGVFHNVSASGDGTTGRVFHNSDEIFAQLSNGNPVNFSVQRTLAPGDTLDFLVDTGPFDADGSDGTTQTATIRQGDGSNSPIQLPIEATVAPSIHPVSAVTLFYRVQFGAKIALPMNDAGTGGDVLAGDGIFTAVIATDALAAGQMLRWRVVAEDSQGAQTRAPLFPEPLDSPEYFGTIANDPATVSSLLPVFHWFTPNPGAADTPSGDRGAVFYLGEFYDNIRADVHGQSTSGFPKKSYDFDFNRGARFRYLEGEDRVKDINMLTNWADKSKTRNTLGYEMMRLAGHPAHFAFPVRIQQNGQFFSVADLVEDGDDRYLERAGLDPAGALYKMYNTLNSSTSGVNKKTLKEEDNSDLQALINGLSQPTAAKLTYSYDNVNIPGTVNYLAALAMTDNRDQGHKNYYLYRDSEVTGEWRPLVWDQDLCLGRNWIGGLGYFDDTLSNNGLELGASNVLKTLIFDTELYPMFLRRCRTLMDQFYGPPGAEVNYLPSRVDEIVALVDPNDDNPLTGTDDSDLDRQKWGTWGNGNATRPAAGRIKTEFVPGKRAQLYAIGNVPGAQSVAPPVAIGTVDYNPTASGASADQSGEYLVLTNSGSAAVDVSGWTLSGGISMTLPAGTVILANRSLHVAKSASGFRSRLVSPTAGENRFLVSGYSGQLSARGETVTLADASAAVIDSISYAGTPTDGQKWLRVSEILYAPLPPTPAELADLPALGASDFEFIELTNIGPAALDISGATFVEGVSFTFPPATFLEPGGRILVVANVAAFERRFGTGLPVAGAFAGKLNNDGEKIQIHDASGENILEFVYNDIWYPPTDDNGYSLVVADPSATPHTDFDLPENWGISLTVGGTPGSASDGLATTYDLWKAARFSTADLADPAIAGDTADSDKDGLNTVLEYALHGDPAHADSASRLSASIVNSAGSDYLALTFVRVRNAIDLRYVVETGESLSDWTPAAVPFGSAVDNHDGTETVTFRDTIARSDSSRRFIRLRVEVGF